MPVRLCLEPGCPELIPLSQRRCAKHAKNAPRSPSSKVTGRRDWRKVRTRVLARDRWTCQHCGAPATEVDHLVPVAAGGAHLDPRNLVASCSPCNQARKGKAARGVSR